MKEEAEAAAGVYVSSFFEKSLTFKNLIFSTAVWSCIGSMTKRVRPSHTFQLDRVFSSSQLSPEVITVYTLAVQMSQSVLFLSFKEIYHT